MEYLPTMAARGPGLEGYGVLLSRSDMVLWNGTIFRFDSSMFRTTTAVSIRINCAWVGGGIRIRSDPEQALSDCEMKLGNGR